MALTDPDKMDAGRLDPVIENRAGTGNLSPRKWVDSETVSKTLQTG